MATALLKMTLTPSALAPMPGAGLKARVLKAFAANAGAMIVASVRNQLGQDALYTLSPDYAARKPSLAGFRRQAGKSSDQPIILTGDIWDHIIWTATGDGLTVQVSDSAGMDDGFDVAEHWEEITEYLEKGLADVEGDLPDLLLDIIVAEMAL